LDGFLRGNHARMLCDSRVHMIPSTITIYLSC
jgi:hypothetical protein